MMKGNLFEKINKLYKVLKKEGSRSTDSHADSAGLTRKIIDDYNRHRPLGRQKYLCYAPFKSIYFGHHGKVIVCCYNRSHIIGTYPDNSIKDIWFGEKANELRDAIRSNDLSKGCWSCLMQIQAYNFDATKAKEKDENTLNPNGFPSVMEFELNNTCNLECIMCSGDFSSLIRANRENREPLKSPYDDKFLKQLRKFIPFLHEVKFYGGEPFLIEIYYKIWEMIIEIKPEIRISVQTNATILNLRVKNILSKANFHIGISLDSLQKKVYESIRVNADFDKVMGNIDFFRKYCNERNTFFGISACMMSVNWREMPDFIRFCNARNIPAYFHTIFFPLDKSIRAMDSGQLKEIIAYYGEHYDQFSEETEVQAKNKKHLGDTINQVKGWLKIALEKENNFIKMEVNSFEEFVPLFEIRLNSRYKPERVQNAVGTLKQIYNLNKEVYSDNDFMLWLIRNLNDDAALTNIVESLETQPLQELIKFVKDKEYLHLK